MIAGSYVFDIIHPNNILQVFNTSYYSGIFTMHICYNISVTLIVACIFTILHDVGAEKDWPHD